MPSNHSSIVGSIFFYIALKEGLNTPATGLAAAILFVVVMDALSLRKNIGRQASVLNKLTFEKLGDAERPLRESIGHKPLEVTVGVFLGFVYAVVLYWSFG